MLGTPRTHLLLGLLLASIVAILVARRFWQPQVGEQMGQQPRSGERFRPTVVKREALAAERTREDRGRLGATPQPLAPSSPPPAKESGPASALAERASPEEPPVAERPLPLDEACAADWVLIAGERLDVLTHRVEQGQFALSPTCREAMEQAEEAQSVRDFVTRCAGPGAPPPEAATLCAERTQDFLSFVVSRTPLPTGDTADLTQVATRTLAGHLGASLAEPRRLDEASLQQAKALVDELLARQPDSYDAHKAKLALLVVDELRFGAPVTDDDYGQVLDELNSFRLGEGVDELRARRAALAEQQEDVEGQLADLTAQRQELGEALAAVSDDAIGAAGGRSELLAEDRQLEVAQRELETERRALERQVRANLLREGDAVDSELVELPFVRLLAKGDLDSLLDEATAYVAENPASPLGYYYRAQAQWRAGERDAAQATLTEAQARGAAGPTFSRLFEREVARTPDDYVDELVSTIGQRLATGAEQAPSD